MRTIVERLSRRSNDAVTPMRPVEHVERPCPDRHRCPGARRIQAAARQARWFDHQSHRSIEGRQGDDRSAAHRAGRDAGVALQSRARHPRRARCRRARGEGRARPDCRFIRCSTKAAPAVRSKDRSTGIDTLVIDLQDIGVRFYTYQLAMGYAMEEAAKRKIAVVVLDRPNPINGWQIEGPLSRDARRRRVAEHVHRLPADADPARHDDGRAGAAATTRRGRSTPT